LAPEPPASTHAPAFPAFGVRAHLEGQLGVEWGQKGHSFAAGGTCAAAGGLGLPPIRGPRSRLNSVNLPPTTPTAATDVLFHPRSGNSTPTHLPPSLRSTSPSVAAPGQANQSSLQTAHPAASPSSSLPQQLPLSLQTGSSTIPPHGAQLGGLAPIIFSPPIRRTFSFPDALGRVAMEGLGGGEGSLPQQFSSSSSVSSAGAPSVCEEGEDNFPPLLRRASSTSSGDTRASSAGARTGSFSAGRSLPFHALIPPSGEEGGAAAEAIAPALTPAENAPATEGSGGEAASEFLVPPSPNILGPPLRYPPTPHHPIHHQQGGPLRAQAATAPRHPAQHFATYPSRSLSGSFPQGRTAPGPAAAPPAAALTSTHERGSRGLVGASWAGLTHLSSASKAAEAQGALLSPAPSLNLSLAASSPGPAVAHLGKLGPTGGAGAAAGAGYVSPSATRVNFFRANAAAAGIGSVGIGELGSKRGAASVPATATAASLAQAAQPHPGHAPGPTSISAGGTAGNPASPIDSLTLSPGGVESSP
jgi:hypothetical protein